MDLDVSLMSTNVAMNLVEMEAHVKMVSMNTFVNVDLVTRVDSVKERLMNVNLIHANTVVPATDTSIPILAHALKVLQAETVKKISTTASWHHAKMAVTASMESMGFLVSANLHIQEDTVTSRWIHAVPTLVTMMLLVHLLLIIETFSAHAH